MEKSELHPGRDMSDTCGACGATLEPSETIHVAGKGPRCYSCFNREIAERIGVEYDEPSDDKQDVVNVTQLSGHVIRQ